MSIDLRTNVPALMALNALNSITKNMGTNIERLSTGYRINSAADDPSGYTLSQKLQTQIRGYDAVSRNIQTGASVVANADAGLGEIYDNLQRIRELAVEASNATVTDFSTYNDEINALRTQIDTLATNTKFNSTPLLTGATSSYVLQVGPNGGDTLDIGSAFADARATTAGGLNLTASVAFANNAAAQAYITTVDAAFTTLNSRTAAVGKYGNLLTSMSSYIEIANENFQAADAAIRNTDIAAESAAFARNQILQQVANAILVQANNIPSLALTLLGQ